MTENPPVQIYPNKIKNRIVFKIKNRLQITNADSWNNGIVRKYKEDVDKDKDVENIQTKLEYVEILFVHCKLFKNDYHYTSKVLFTFVPSKQFGQFINISPHSLMMMSTVNTDFSSVKVWFTDQVSKALEIEDKVNLTLIVG